MAFRVFLALCVRRHSLRELQLSFRDCSRLALTASFQPSPEGICWSESTHFLSFHTQARFQLSSKSLVSSHGMGHLRPSTGAPASSREIRRSPIQTPHRSGSSSDASVPSVQPEGQSFVLLHASTPAPSGLLPRGVAGLPESPLQNPTSRCFGPTRSTVSGPVPTSCFRCTLPVFSACGLQVCCALQPVMGFVAFGAGSPCGPAASRPKSFHRHLASFPGDGHQAVRAKAKAFLATLYPSKCSPHQ